MSRLVGSLKTTMSNQPARRLLEKRGNGCQNAPALKTTVSARHREKGKGSNRLKWISPTSRQNKVSVLRNSNWGLLASCLRFRLGPTSFHLLPSLCDYVIHQSHVDTIIMFI